MKKPDISVVIPAYNESVNVTPLCKAFGNYAKTVDFNMQLVFVDDGSVDDTVALLRAARIEGVSKKIVKLSRNFGAHPAIKAGIYYADADRVMLYSMDMPEPIEDIGRFYEKLDEGFEVVYSEREGYQGSFGSRMFGKMTTRFIEPTYPENGVIGVAFGSKAKKELNSNIENNSSIYFQLFGLGFSKTGIPVTYAEREQGESKWTLRKKMKLFVDSFVMFSYAPIRAITTVGMIMALLGIVWALAIIVIKVVSPTSLAAGWPTMMSILLVGFGITNISLGIIAEYLMRTLDAARRRPTFVIDEVNCED